MLPPWFAYLSIGPRRPDRELSGARFVSSCHSVFLSLPARGVHVFATCRPQDRPGATISHGQGRPCLGMYLGGPVRGGRSGGIGASLGGDFICQAYGLGCDRRRERVQTYRLGRLWGS